MHRYLLPVLILFTGLTAPAQDPGTFQWQFKEGDKFYLENVTAVKQTMEFLGQTIPVESENIIVSSFKVLKADRDTVVLEKKVEGAKAKAAKGLPLPNLNEMMQGMTFKVTLNRQGTVQKVEGREDFLRRLGQDNEELAKLFEAMISEDTLKQDFQEAFAFGPGKAVVKGDSWKRPITVPLGPMGSFLVESNYTYQGKAADGEEIAVKQEFTYKAPKGDAGGLPFKVSDGKFKTEESTGLIVFDPVKGRLVRYEMKARMKGTMTITVGDQEAMMTMEQRTDTRIRVMDRWLRDF
jgi:hypothetical protein